MSIVGNFVLGGYIGDRIGSRRVLFVSFILMGISQVVLVQAQDIWMLYLFAVLSGFAFGGGAVTEAPIVAKLFGLSSHGLILGFVGIGFTTGASLGPLVTGFLFDLTGAYTTPFSIGAGVAMVGLTLAFILRPRNRLDTRL